MDAGGWGWWLILFHLPSLHVFQILNLEKTVLLSELETCNAKHKLTSVWENCNLSVIVHILPFPQESTMSINPVQTFIRISMHVYGRAREALLLVLPLLYTYLAEVWTQGHPHPLPIFFSSATSINGLVGTYVFWSHWCLGWVKCNLRIHFGRALFIG